MKRTLLLITFLLLGVNIKAQDLLSFKVEVEQSQPLPTYLLALEERHDVKFFFAEEWLLPFEITISANGKTIRDALNLILEDSGIHFEEHFGYAIIFVKDPRNEERRDSILRVATITRKSVDQTIIGDARSFKPGKRVQLKGIVKDEVSGNPMKDVIVMLNDREVASTDEYGAYKLVTISGGYILSFSYPNYREKVIDLRIYDDGDVNVFLEETPVILDEVVVSEQALTNRIGESSLKMTDLKRSPTFLGERDLVKQIQLQPGVTTVSEVATGFNVRGGGVDQNLVLYDNIPVFNTSHAFGFFTAFNSEAIQQVQFYRGGIPSQFGGRASSVLDITSKEGAYDQWHGSGGIGIISSQLALSGPIKRDTASIHASFRTSYSNWLLQSIKSDYDLRYASVKFYDASIKLTQKFTARTKLTLSAYSSSDEFSLTNDTTYMPRNLASSIKLDHIFNEKFFGSVTASFGQFSYTMSEPEEHQAFELKYEIQYPSLRLDFHVEKQKHKISFGAQSTLYTFQPGDLTGSKNSSTVNFIMPDEKALESGLYISDALEISNKLLIEAGARYSMYHRLGQGVTYLYDDNKAREPMNIKDSITYTGGDVMKMYQGLEPRLSMRYTLNDNSAIKFGYNRIFQYLHLVTNTAAVAPVDIWQTSNEYFKPQRADQVSLGYYKNFNNNVYETFVESFYKEVQNTLDFKDGSQLILNKHLETALISGHSTSYGVELSAAKVKGRLTGTFSYTFSRSLRQTDGRFPTERINDGKTYSSNYDQPHVGTVTWRYAFSRRHFFAGTFTYHTGRPTSLPTSFYQIDGVSIPNFSERNKFRIPDYHRLDVAFIIEGNHKRKKLLDGTWIVSFYNVYSRKNAYSLYFEDNGKGMVTTYKLSVIGSIIPSVTYSFKF
ncbi:TonB-dependent receptor [Pseudochryseolinea flava]|uniref:TonB-dependent receptor plug domain-containing protein n=1 Tax=Pseudochryseolinea flava TaxID=2059302 RepID=A0A364Y8S6_9BACT|nr:TonB-dependent receptor plug domain-containing protein [Pseudochryseolinea flava]RAW03313.1 hypothetical protein DQQ10_04305 [Pseudochryseolinea flava]